MKKIFALGLILIVLSAAANAQRPRVVFPNSPRGTFPNIRPNTNQLSWGEKKELRKDAIRYHIIKRRALRDGLITPIERRKLRKAKCEGRRDLFRFKHNSRRRLI
jgi:hypothetical protein